MRWICCAAAVLVFIATARADTPQPSPKKPLKIAIVSSVAVNVDVARVDALSQDLAEALMVELDVEVIGGLEVRRELPAEGLPSDCVATAACVEDVARRLGADQLLFAAMVDVGNTGAIQIDIMWVDPIHNARESRPAIALASLDNAKARFLANAHKLLPDVPAREPPAPPVPRSVIMGAMTPAVPRHVTTPVVVASGGVLLGLGVGIGFGLTARSRYFSCKADPCTEERTHSIKTFSLVADLGHVTWVTSAGIALYLYMTSGSEPRLVLTPTEDGVSAAFTGRF